MHRRSRGLGRRRSCTGRGTRGTRAFRCRGSSRRGSGARCRRMHPLGAVHGGISPRRARSYRPGMEEGCEGGLRAVASDRSAGGDPGAGGDRAVGVGHARRAAAVPDGGWERGAAGVSARVSRSRDSSPGVVGTTFGPGASSCRWVRRDGKRCTRTASGERSRSMPKRCSRRLALLRSSGRRPRPSSSEASPRSTGSTRSRQSRKMLKKKPPSETA